MVVEDPPPPDGAGAAAPDVAAEGADTDAVAFGVAGGVAVIRLNRPHRGNALTLAMHRRMRTLWEQIRTDDAVRCVIVTGTGERHFCTGADLHDVSERGTVNAGPGTLREELAWTARQTGVWKPVICAVNGLAAGGGLHFVVDADIVVAARTASFLDSHVNVGMVAGLEGVGLARRLPLGTALRMTLQGRAFRLDAGRAHQLGLVDELAEPAELMATAQAIAADIAANSPRAVALTQQAVWEAREAGHQAALEHAWALVRTHWSHPDFAEGPRAFAQRRPPRWQDGPA